MLPINKITGYRILASMMIQNVMRSDFLVWYSSNDQNISLFDKYFWYPIEMRNAQVDMLYFIHNLYYGARNDVLRITCQNYELLNHFKLTRALNTMQIVF